MLINILFYVNSTRKYSYHIPNKKSLLFRNGSRTDVNEDINAELDKDGFYKVTARHHYDNLTLTDLTIFVCNLSIPGTDYQLSKTLELELGNDKKELTGLRIR